MRSVIYSEKTIILVAGFLVAFSTLGRSQVNNADSATKKIISKSGEYSVMREERGTVSSSVKYPKMTKIDVLRDKTGKTLWEKYLPGEAEEVQEINGKPNVVVKIYSSKRRVKFDEKGNVVRLGDKFPKQLKIKNEYSSWSDESNPLQIIDNKTGQVLKELPLEGISFDCISEDGQNFVTFESTFTYTKEAFKKAKELEGHEFRQQDAEKWEFYLTLYNVEGKVVWKKRFQPLEKNNEALTYVGPRLDSFEGTGKDLQIVLWDAKLTKDSGVYLRKFNRRGEEIGKIFLRKNIGETFNEKH